MYLNKETMGALHPEVKVPLSNRPLSDGAIVHFGIGGFHRSHQAYAIQQLIQLNPDLYSNWNICGVCILPNDKAFVDRMKKQDLLYSLRMSASGVKEDVMVLNVITELLFGPENHQAVIDRIADAKTKIVSFTITEGGYNIDGATGEFLHNHPDIQNDVNAANAPKTVFGYLGRALSKRRDAGMGPITLMSCDNIQENGDVLKMTLYNFLKIFDESLISYADANASFPNSMVDRITPVTQEADRKELQEKYGYQDDCLVVCEPFFQWVIEKNKLGLFPPLEKVGVTFVDDVRPYERMKLGILNGGHSLVGLIGKALGYEYIHEAVNDERISKLFELYNKFEVVPSLIPLEDMDYQSYVVQIKNRFSNEMLKDSTDRIISGSTAKIPKFVLPVILDQLSKGANGTIGALILAAWWHYLDTRISEGRTADIDDPSKDEWQQLFQSNLNNTLSVFIGKADVFGGLGKNEVFFNKVRYFADVIRKEGVSHACDQAIKSFI